MTSKKPKEETALVPFDDENKVSNPELMPCAGEPPGEDGERHDWHKHNLVTVKDKNGMYDLMVCEKCGAKKKCYGLNRNLPEYGCNPPKKKAAPGKKKEPRGFGEPPEADPTDTPPARETYDLKINIRISPHDGGDPLTRQISIDSLHSDKAIYDPELIREALVVADTKVKVDQSQRQLPL